MALRTKYKHIRFESYMDSMTHWHCVANNGGAFLGSVEYYKPWKRFVFYASTVSCVFSADCLRDIADFLEQLEKGGGCDGD